jgi:multiple sugar transport system substrate-binding protein
MSNLSRRSLIRASMAAAASGTLARPYIANAAATTATVWWVQGFAHEEDIAFSIDYSLIPYAPHRQKVISALTSGDVPDLFPANPAEIVAIYAWQGKLVDVSDVVQTQQSELSATALLSAQCYNGVTKKRSFYGVPFTGAVLPMHVWKSLVVKAGYKPEDIPNTWDARWDFFKSVQKRLREQHVRNVYGMGLQVTTNGVDPNATFHYFLIAYGGNGVVTKDGRLHVDDPKVKAAAVQALIYPTTAYKEGFVPPGAINWNDADDNNAFHSKQVVADLDGTISTEVAIMKNKEDYDDILTLGLPNSNDGHPVASQLTVVNGLIPEGAQNVVVAKEFMKYLIQPDVNNEWLKVGLGRNIPMMVSIVTKDPWWFADPHRATYPRQGVLGQTVPAYWAFNPAYAQVQNEHVWSTAWTDILNGGMKADAAYDKAAKRIEEIFAKYPIVQS